MNARRRSWIAAAGIATVVVAGGVAASGPGQRLAGPTEVIWIGRLAFVSALAAVLGAAVALGGFIQRGAALSLASGAILVATGFTIEGIAALVGATMAIGVGRPPHIEDLTVWRGETS